MKFLQLVILSWIFMPGKYTHYQGQRVHQYYAGPFVEELPDPRRGTYIHTWRHYREWNRDGSFYHRYQDSRSFMP